VEADDEKDARNRATETGIVIDAVTVAPFAPPPAAQPPAVTQPRGRGMVPGTFIPGVVIGVVIGVVLVFLLQRHSGPAPHEQFKAISDRKKAQLTQFLESKQSSLSSYKATVAEESDVDKRAEASHVGIIAFSYTVTRPERGFQTLHSALAAFRFSTKEKKWVYEKCVQEGGFLEPKELLVNFADVKAAFEGKRDHSK
jgi:hypothetical protein